MEEDLQKMRKSQNQKKKEAKKVAKKPEKNADFDDDELKAIDKIKMGDEKPKSFKEY